MFHSGFLDSDPLREADEDLASEVNLSNSIMTEEEREEIQQELAKVRSPASRRLDRTRSVDCLKTSLSSSLSLCVCIQLEEEISTLKQVLSSKEKQHAELRQKLGVTSLGELKNNFSRGWHDMQTSVA